MERGKRGQVTIFIIIAVIIVAAAVILYLTIPAIRTTLGVQQQNPRSFMQTCLEKDIQNTIDTISLHGGDFNPTFYSTYDSIKIKNLCYTTLYCDLCKLQAPQLQLYVEREIKNNLQTNVQDCFNSMKDSYVKQGYTVDLQTGNFNVDLFPNKAVTSLNYSLTLTKTSTEKYDSFSVVVNNNLYELIAIANSILGYVSTAPYGDVDVTIYMSYYPTIKVDKGLLGDGTKIYIITDRTTGDKFEFASRSMVLGTGGYC